MQLEIDFHGPIAFRFGVDRVWAYVPYCDQHYCNITTDMNDLGIDPAKDPKTYTITGPTPAKTTLGSGHPVVSLKWAWGSGPQEKDCFCIFVLPSPNVIFGLQGEYAKIVTDSETMVNDHFARGLRFSYDNCDNLKINDAGLDATHFGNAGLGSVGISYHDTNFAFDKNHPHKDADECSLSMRKLFPPCDQWQVSFDPPDADSPEYIENIGGRPPRDCGANPLVFLDGITL